MHLAAITEDCSRANQAHEGDDAESEQEAGDLGVASGDTEEASNSKNVQVDGETTHAVRAEGEENASSDQEDSNDDTRNSTVLAGAEVKVVTSGKLKCKKTQK